MDSKISRLRKKKTDGENLGLLLRDRKKLTSTLSLDPEYRRLRYIRYADDFLLGFVGSKDEAKQIKTRIGTFLRESLKLELSPEKTLITHARTERAMFLGYDESVNAHRGAQDRITLNIPPAKLEAKVTKYRKDGKPAARPELMADSDFSVVSMYGSEYQGFVQYYGFARNIHWLNRLRWVMETSMLKTLAAKHQSSVQEMAQQYKAKNNNHINIITYLK